MIVSESPPQHRIFSDPSLPWTVDMDGTLIREDVTELAFAKSIRNPLLWHVCIYGTILWATQGLPHFQRHLESKIVHNPKELSYNSELMDLISQFRDLPNAANVVLATASHIDSAIPVATHTSGLFDDIIGSDPTKGLLDLRAKEKARVLTERFPEGFLYAGNSDDDLDVWECETCKAMLLVNCSPEVLEKARYIQKPQHVIL